MKTIQDALDQKNQAQPGKQELRRKLLARRKDMPLEEVEQRSQAAQKRLMQSHIWAEATTVLLYADCRNELRTNLLLAALWQRGAQALLPRCCRRSADEDPACSLTGELELAEVASSRQLTAGAYGIAEPDPELCPAVAEASVDLAVLPGVAFDPTGGRLGYGGGYYDRLIASGRLKDTVLVGLAYAWQLVPKVPCEDWDLPVHGVCTDKELLWI